MYNHNYANSYRYNDIGVAPVKYTARQKTVPPHLLRSMKPDHKKQKDKQLIGMVRELNILRKQRREAGIWEEVEPYVHGYYRTYELRDDIKNRRDAKEIREVLQMINSVKYCRRKDFLAWNYKTNKKEDIAQPLGAISKQKYDALSEKHKSFFYLTYSRENMSKQLIPEYRFKYDYYFVKTISENIITHHWIPDANIERLYAELNKKMVRDNLWPKHAKARSKSLHNGYDHWEGIYRKNKMGELMDDSRFEE